MGTTDNMNIAYDAEDIGRCVTRLNKCTRVFDNITSFGIEQFLPGDHTYYVVANVSLRVPEAKQAQVARDAFKILTEAAAQCDIATQEAKTACNASGISLRFATLPGLNETLDVIESMDRGPERHVRPADDRILGG